jgi:DNA-directed RNA polymerase I, II, and III subunit RPABC4
MSREQYQIPTSGSPSVGAGSGATGTGSFNASAARDYDSGGVMYYMCGDCAVRVPLEKGAPIRCQKCGARVLYKERTKRYGASWCLIFPWRGADFGLSAGWFSSRRGSHIDSRGVSGLVWVGMMRDDDPVLAAPSAKKWQQGSAFGNGVLEIYGREMFTGNTPLDLCLNLVYLNVVSCPNAR